MIVDAKIENYDNLIEQIQEANEMGISISTYDTNKFITNSVMKLYKNKKMRKQNLPLNVLGEL